MKNFYLTISLLIAFPFLNAEFVPNQIVVVFREDIAKVATLSSLTSKYQAKLVYQGRYGKFQVLQITNNIDQAIEKLKNEPGVAVAEPNYRFYLTSWIPDDPYFDEQWNFVNIEIPEAWEISQGGSKNIKIGILDSGIAFEDYPIPDYERDEVESGDGYYHKTPDLTNTEFASGYDAVHQDDHPNDQNGHGTHVAGTIASSTNNGYGVAGIAFNSTLVPIQVANYYGAVELGWLLDGLSYAIETGVNILNMSFGGYEYSEILQNKIIAASKAGIIMVAASGNDGRNEITYPARFDEVIAVGAVDKNDKLTSYSNYGSGIDLVAPGGTSRYGILQETYKIYQDDPYDTTQHAEVDDFKLHYFQGTSMASPHVTGVVALLMALGVGSPEDIRSYIQTTALDLGKTGYDTLYGYGRINAKAALEAVYSVSLNKLPLSYGDSISYKAPPQTIIELSLYDILGRKVSVLSAGKFSGDKPKILAFDMHIASGVYFLALKGENKTIIRKLVYLK